MKKHTPTRGGQWRVIDGELVDESALPPAEPVEQIPAGEPIPVITQEGVAEPGEALPEAAPPPSRSRRRKAPSNAK